MMRKGDRSLTSNSQWGTDDVKIIKYKCPAVLMTLTKEKQYGVGKVQNVLFEASVYDFV